MDDLPRFQLEEEEGEERSKEEINDLQEVTRPDLSCVVAQKGRPSLALRLLGTNRPHVLLNGALADSQAQFQ